MVINRIRVYRWALGIALVLSIPLIAMQFSSEVNWNLMDFLVGGLLLAGTAIMIEIAIQKATEQSYRLAAIASILVGLLLVWVELAVGIFGTPLAGS